MLDYSPLLKSFHQLRQQAETLPSPNPQDHRRIRLAIVGFGQSSDVSHWGLDKFQFMEDRLQSDLSEDDFSADWIDFACLAMGYQLGCIDAGILKTDEEFRIADAQLPGFMWLHAEQLSDDLPE